jgi:predicted dehydrogenase
VSASTLRIGIIGMGWGRRAHLPAFAALPDVQVRAIVDSHSENLRAIADEYGIPRIERDAMALLSDPDDLDALVIATPTDTHYELVLAALQAGLHVFCEKPLGYDVPQAEAMVAALEGAGVTGRIGFLFRHSPVIQHMKQLVDDGFIGELQMFESININPQFHSPAAPLHWKMLEERAGGGVYVEYGSHQIDLALWFGGPLRHVVAHGMTLVDRRANDSGHSVEITSDDSCAWIGEYASGGQALFRSGWASLPPGGGGLRLYGSRGSLAWQLDPTTRQRETLLAVTPEQPEGQVLLEYRARNWGSDRMPLGLLSDYNANLVAAFVTDLRDGATSAPTFHDGLAVQHVLTAIRTSLDEQRWVEIGR